MRTRLARACTLLLLSYGVFGCMPDSSGLNSGTPAPEIRGRDAQEKPFPLSDYRGKVVLLDFWASY